MPRVSQTTCCDGLRRSAPCASGGGPSCSKFRDSRHFRHGVLPSPESVVFGEQGRACLSDGGQHVRKMKAEERKRRDQLSAERGQRVSRFGTPRFAVSSN